MGEWINVFLRIWFSRLRSSPARFVLVIDLRQAEGNEESVDHHHDHEHDYERGDNQGDTRRRLRSRPTIALVNPRAL